MTACTGQQTAHCLYIQDIHSTWGTALDARKWCQCSQGPGSWTQLPGPPRPLADQAFGRV